MTFYQSRAISKAGLHVRRAAWSADKWLMIWRGTWFCFASGNPAHPVRATDYSAADLLATDWTTMPAALAACPIDPTIGSTGGASATPGSPGFPDDTTPPIVSISGSGTPSGPDDPTVLPAPDPGSGRTITYADITKDPAATSIAADPNGTYPLKRDALSGNWTATFVKGVTNPGDANDPIIWTIVVSDGPLFDTELSCLSDGFFVAAPLDSHGAGLNVAAALTALGGSPAFSGGTATVR